MSRFHYNKSIFTPRYQHKSEDNCDCAAKITVKTNNKGPQTVNLGVCIQTHLKITENHRKPIVDHLFCVRDDLEIDGNPGKPLVNLWFVIPKHLEINQNQRNQCDVVLKVIPLSTEISILAWTCDNMGASTLRAHCGTWWAHCGHTAKMNLLVIAGSKEYWGTPKAQSEMGKHKWRARPKCYD